MAAKIKKGDQVAVLSGKYKGTTGEVLQIRPQDNRVLVKGVNVVKKHTKQSQTSAGGIVEAERPIHLSNVALVDPKDNKPTRVGFKTLKDGTKVRYAKRSGETVE